MKKIKKEKQPLFDCSNAPLPISYITKQVAIDREKHFNENHRKGNIDDDFLHEQYSITEFKSLLTLFSGLDNYSGVRVYFGAKKTQRFKDNIVLIFTPTIDDLNGIEYLDNGDYYIWASGQFWQITKGQAQTLATNYGNLYKKVIDKILFKGKKVRYGNTKSILYQDAIIKSLMGEINLPCHASRLKFIRASFSSYLDSDIDAIKNRMILQLQFVEVNAAGNHLIYGLDEINRNYKKDASEGAFDTVSPCPPESCDGAELNP